MFSLQRGVVSSWQEEKSHMSSNLNVNEFNDEKIHCSLNADSGSSFSPEKNKKIKYEPFSDMVMWLRRVSIDPCNKKSSSSSSSSSESQCRRVLKVRTVLSLNTTELPWKKRKHRQLLKESSSTAAIESIQKPNDEHDGVAGLLCIGQRSLTASCLINCTDSAESSDDPILLKHPRLDGEKIQGDNLSRKRVIHEHSFQADAMDWNRSPTKEHPILICSDDSCSDSNPPSPVLVQMRHASAVVEEILESGDDLSVEQQVDISSNHQADLVDKSSPTNKQSPSFDSDDFDDSDISSNQSSSPMKPKVCLRIARRLSPRLTKFTVDSPSIVPIPVGPRFQADLPDWTGSTTNDDDDSNSRWLGTRVWPVEGRKTESNSVFIGKGRPCSCSCGDLGSTKCIKRHLVEKRLQLRADLGPAYFIWRFNEMGEEVSRSWTQKEQNSFDILVKTNPVSKNKSFLKPALKYFTSKCRESIVSYYFNVAVLRRLSRRTRSDPASADSDDDEADGSAGYSKSVRTRYLIRHR